ncbi:MAG: NAD(P)/FAD-dependent oxidoreductase [Marmoricola sp.]
MTTEGNDELTTPGTGPWDLVVVGAGPAGAATALGARHADPSLRVLLLDRADFPRDKCCGDGIAPHVLEALASVGVDRAAAGWATLTRLELTRGGSSVTGTMARPVHVIPREVFDARLVEAATAAGARFARHRVSGLARHGDEVVLDDRIRARVVVGADGAHSVVRSWLGDAGPGRRALAIRGYAPTPVERRGSQVIRYGDRRQPSYAWAFDRGDGLSNVGYGELLPDHGGDHPSRALLLEQLERLLPGSTTAGTSWRAHHLPLSGWRWQQPDGPVLLTGDAAGLVNPMTGEGIYYAVATGILAGRAAAHALAAGDPGRAGGLHRRSVRQALARNLRHTWFASRLSRLPTFVDASIAAAGRNGRIFDDLVEIGLGDGLITPRLAGGLALALAATGAACRTDPR